MNHTNADIPESLSAVGIDVGSIFIKVVGLDRGAKEVFRFKKVHRGDPHRILDEFLEDPRLEGKRIGISGSAGQEDHRQSYDPHVCLHSAVRSFLPEVRNILEVGGGHLSLIRLDDDGRITAIHRNSLCASGTGSFLDAQAARMDIDYHNGGCAEHLDDPPSIATRCAVFAKSDLIYRQQEGVSKESLWSGLCRGLADGLIHSLIQGRPLKGLTVFCGGVALNEIFTMWLRSRVEDGSDSGELVVMPHPEFAVARGAALLASGTSVEVPAVELAGKTTEVKKRRPELRLERTRYPEKSQWLREKDGAGNEFGVHKGAHGSLESGDLNVYVGVDIGSTSTKLVVIDAEGRILLDVYRATGGEPIGAIVKLFNAVIEISRKEGWTFNVRGAATTGSGRKLIGSLIGADLVINEISAHVLGATHLQPGVETIFEIGGQDAKFVSIKNGEIVDANMNYVCAAGTGSFIEEQAAKLGYGIDEIGETALGTSPPYTSSRCTVFMEQDIDGLLKQNVSRREAAGAVMYSVIDNYLEQVVGRRTVSPRRVFFQGATARNRGLVAAIENILDVEVVVSPFCHVLGAYGAALQVRNKARTEESRFHGFDLGKRMVRIEGETCELCSKRCHLSRAILRGTSDRPVWGMKCGREERSGKRAALPGYALFERVLRMSGGTEAGGTDTEIGAFVRLPRALTIHSDYVFWKAFFAELGISVLLGPVSSERSIGLGRAYSGPDFCLPLKTAVGQAGALLHENDRHPIFVPYMLADYPSSRFSQSRFCPYVEVLPSMIQAALRGNGFNLDRLISPVVDLRRSDRTNAAILSEALAPFFPISLGDAERAFSKAHQARRKHNEGLLSEGEKALGRIRRHQKPAVALIGRPYSVMDSELNKKVPLIIAQTGFEVIPISCLEGMPDGLTGEFRNLFWAYGQRILSVLLRVANTEGLYAVLLSNFGCGPDSFLLSYAEKIMGDKPFLILEIDEHGAAGGYETRIEAFFDVIRRDWEQRNRHSGNGRAVHEPASPADIKERTLWFPQMHPVGNRFLVAAFRGEGYDARTLPLEDESTLSLGKRWTRGAECLPMSLTLGAFLNQILPGRQSGAETEKKAALFLPTSTGPCRFGQYRTLTRMVLERLNLEDIPILSPGAHNAYYGLPGRLRRKAWEAVCGGDVLFKMRCRVFPYEVTRGDTEATLERWSLKAEELVESDQMAWAPFLEEAMTDFLRIPTRQESRPLVGIVGEIYVRCNPFANGGVINAVEKLGGEIWLAPVAEWILYTAWIERYLSRIKKRGLRKTLEIAAKWKYFSVTEHKIYRRLGPLLGERIEPSMDDIIKAAGDLLPPDFQGESILTVGRAVLFGESGADLVINCSPFGCMHGNITNAVFEQMRDVDRVPVVNISYDGTEEHSVLNAFMYEAWRKKR